MGKTVNKQLCVCILVCLIAGSWMCGGCAKDRPVYVTPFVLKPSEVSPVSETPAPDGLRAGTRAYEEAVRGGPLSASGKE